MLCNMIDGVSIRRNEKNDSYMSIVKPNVSMTNMTQPEHIIPRMRSSSDPSGLWNRFKIIAPFVDFKSYGEVESLDDEKYFFSSTRSDMLR